MLLKYECDCVGFETTDEEGNRHAWCVVPCDAHWDEPYITLYERQGLLEKDSTPLPHKETVGLLTQIGRLVAGGHDFRKLKNLLGLPLS